MQAPDKIIVSPYEVFDYDLDIQEVGHNGAEEYIRKGAILEWAKGLYERTMTFVSGDIEKDYEIQMFALRISKHIEQL